MLQPAGRGSEPDGPGISAKPSGGWGMAYGEALPKELLSQEQGAAIMRVVSLAGAPTVPEALIREILEDARDFVGGGATV